MLNHEIIRRSRRHVRGVSTESVNSLCYVLFISVAFLAIVACIANNQDGKQCLVIIPIGYTLVNLVFYHNFSDIENNIPRFIIHALYFVRLVVLPLLYVFSGAEKLFEGAATVTPHFATACLLMVYEYFAVQLALWLISRAKRIKFGITTVSGLNIGGKLIILMTAFVLIVGVFFPQYGFRFKSIMQLNEVNFTISERYNHAVGTIGRIIHTLFALCAQLVRVLLPALIMRYFYKKNSAGKAVTFVMVLGSALQFFFLTSTFAEAIVSAVVLILYYINLYPERSRKTMVFLLLSSVGIVCMFFAVRFVVKDGGGLYGTKDPIKYAASIINAYFTGVDNVSAALNVPVGMKWESFRADLLGAIPFNTTLFGNVGNKFQYYFNFYNSSYGQIPPTVGVGYYYFGALLSPLFSVLFVCFSQQFYRSAQRNKDSLNFVSMSFCSVVFALGTVMYSFAIALQWFFSWGLIMLLITKLTSNLSSSGR